MAEKNLLLYLPRLWCINFKVHRNEFPTIVTTEWESGTLQIRPMLFDESVEILMQANQSTSEYTKED